MMKFTLMAPFALALLAMGCGDDSGNRPTGDAGADRDAIAIPDATPDADVNRPDRVVPDATPVGCGIGDNCTAARGCALPGSSCQEPLGAGPTGGGTDPIFDDMGMATAMTFTSTLFGMGYCTTALVNLGATPPSCDLNDEASCPAGSSCQSLGTLDGIPRTFCAKDCEFSITENTCLVGGCPGNNACNTNDFCLDGCNGDNLLCQVERVDTNGDGTIDAPGMGMMAVDQLTIAPAAANARCEAATNNCTHDGTAGAEAGQGCTRDTDCEAGGFCIYGYGEPGDWGSGAARPGYCSKLRCDTAGNECAGAGKCQERGLGIDLCLKECTVANTVGGDRFAPNADCDGAQCFWDGVTPAGMPNGGCIPGNYNAITTDNVGAACLDAAGAQDDSLCASPYGGGDCLEIGGLASCVVRGCADPGKTVEDTCGADGTCATFTGGSLCFETCTAAADCAFNDTVTAGDPQMGCMDGMLYSQVLGLTVDPMVSVCSQLCVALDATGMMLDEAAADAQCGPGAFCDGDMIAGGQLQAGVCRQMM
ncbi:MAG: hypothetical protein AAGF12_03465 [Myxococcota bacterium]